MYIPANVGMCETGDLRLTGGTVESEGTIEVCTDGIWVGSICDDGWDHLAAQVVCRQLGYLPEGGLQHTPHSPVTSLKNLIQ